MPRMNEQEAKNNGLTHRISITSDQFDLDLLVDPDFDMDASFTAFDIDCGETIKVRGWMFTLEMEG
nr:hypothetical protein [uncultured Cohaesibacter sp.]